MQPLDQAWTLLKFEGKTLRDQASDPLDLEYTCPNCGGAGGGYEEEGALDSYVGCLRCGDTGSLAPAYHPGHPDLKPDGIEVGATRFDVRDKQHMEEYDAANAAPTPHVNLGKVYPEMMGKPGYSAIGIADPYRYGYPKAGPVKMTRYPITDLSQAEPGLEHREPAVYTREIDGNPSFAGEAFQGYFTMSEPFDAAWRLLKEDDRGPNETTQGYNYRLFNENKIRNEPDRQHGESLEDFQTREDRYNQQVCYCGSGKVKQSNAYGPDMCSDCFKEIGTNTVESFFQDENEPPTVEAETGITPRSAAVGAYGIDTFGQKNASESFDAAWALLR